MDIFKFFNEKPNCTWEEEYDYFELNDYIHICGIEETEVKFHFNNENNTWFVQLDFGCDSLEEEDVKELECDPAFKEELVNVLKLQHGIDMSLFEFDRVPYVTVEEEGLFEIGFKLKE